MAEQDHGVEELLDRLLEGRKPEELVGARGLLEGLTKQLYERARRLSTPRVEAGQVITVPQFSSVH
jgi:hypothetical protein